MTLLKARDISVTDGRDRLVQPLSLTLRPGRALTILGESGSGKSLLAQAILGTLPKGLHASGELHVDDVALDPARPRGNRALWGRLIAVLPQEPWLALDPLMRAGRQVEETHRMVAGSADARAATARDLSELGLSGAGARWPWQLSGGMAQRLAFAAARAGGAPITVADEPTKGLDADRRDDVLALLQRGLRDGGGLLTITHDLDLARGLGGDIIVIRDGCAIEQGEAAKVLADPSHPYTRRLIEADPARWPPRKPSVPGAALLRARDLVVSRGGRALTGPQDIDLHRGEVMGIQGPSGCGKSSLGNALLGLLPVAGSVWRDPSLPKVAFQKLWQDPVAAFPRRLRLGQGIDDLVALHRLDASEVAPLMARLALRSELLDRLPAEVSGGELQRLALLRALLLKPAFLFADEPTSRLDPVTQAETFDLLTGIARERDMAMMIVSHDASLLRASCDRVLRLPDQPPAR
ncbi:ABC transporter ATP-binding protein [Paracoccus zeaxanthinifaciens]|uniref:ABC transporter ATP-binding protein n=1 Tax=Paracoccus zeaxanthinifaciens TaxID=187400 RepID=UPI0003B3B33C|nr:ATP-binding cassette domain-containing protein [Paracoccus zeaxanthinifaciens]